MRKRIQEGIIITAYDFYQSILGLKDKNLIQELVSATEIRYLKKGEFVVRIGEVQSDIYFLETGIARGCFLDVNGKDVTDCLIFRCGCTAVSYELLEWNTPSSISIETLEDSSFFRISFSVIMSLTKQYEEVRTLYDQMLLTSMKEHWEIKNVLNSRTAVQRYQWFLGKYPGWIDRISYKHIASFLGMTPVTLSRLRKTLREEADEGSGR